MTISKWHTRSYRLSCELLLRPVPGLVEYRREDRLGTVEGTTQAFKEPFERARDVEIALLCRFEDFVVGLALCRICADML